MMKTDPSESVVINHFWRLPAPVFHARSLAGTRCRPNTRRPACRHALPRRLAEKIARPCRKCYPTKKDS